MKPLLIEMASAILTGLEFGVGLIRLLASLGFAVMICCGIADGDEPARPESWFRKDAFAQAPNGLLKQPVRKSEPRPNSWFRKDTPAAPPVQPVPVVEPQANIPAPPPPVVISDDSEQPFAETTEPVVALKPIARAMTLGAFLRSAVEIFDELPAELGEDGPEQVAAESPVIEGVAYMPRWCTACWSVAPGQFDNPSGVINANCPVNRLMSDPRFKIKISPNDLPKEYQPPGEFAYPLIRVEKRAFWSKLIDTPDSLANAVKQYMPQKFVVAAPRDIVVGTVPRDLSGWLTVRSDSGPWHFNNQAETFTQKAFTVSIPAGVVIKGSTVKGGSRIDFIGIKPRIKVTGFWSIYRNVNAVIDSPTKITLCLNWWQTISWEKR